MSEENEEVAPNAPKPGVGQRLRAAREAKGLTLDQLAAETRISRRHLEHIEAGEFEDLAGRTYALGFAKTFAKAVGLDPGAIADEVREEMELEPATPQARPEFQPGEAANAPSRGLVWFSIFAVILLLVGLFFAGRNVFGGEVEWDSLVEEAAPVEAESASDAADQSDAPAPSGPVVFTAEDVVWVRFTDAAGLVLKEGEMAAGESYTVPANADAPVVITGRPDLLAITIGGKPVPRLSTEPLTVVDAPVSAAALLARAAPVSAAGEEGAAQPSAQPRTAAPSPRRDARPTPRPAPSARPADAESVSNAAPAAPRFVSEPVVQAIEPRNNTDAAE